MSNNESISFGQTGKFVIKSQTVKSERIDGFFAAFDGKKGASQSSKPVGTEKGSEKPKRR